ncbi:hypothetical protein MYCGRDRAFT_82116 [Paecilomyces variotii No. 5]|uniref:Thioredoxin n=1 Tax=Byssochlamys spectabilis (strain No. 5 / NBRC 109023) TaxID=1356009 RepID=V5FBM0_BYSSN|nr:hypothetical protein MYCGRDRAFT_82116 [Paecilomyces variotii No. 5]
MGVHNVSTKSEFTEKTGQGVAVVDFFATWCGPCKAIAPKIEELSEKYPSATFYKVDVDTLSDVAAEIGIRAMPTFHVYKNGERVEEIVGANPPAIEAAIKKHAE